MCSRFLSIILGIVLPIGLGAQVSFEASSNVKKVSLNSYFEVAFTLKNADGKGFMPPGFEGFVVYAGPYRSASVTSINGVRSSELTYTYTLKPTQKGKFTIGSAKIKANGKTYTSKPIQIEVVDAKALESQSGENDVFVEAILSSTEAVVGQQITLDYKLYTAVNIDNYNVLEESDYQGFYAHDLRRFDLPPAREMIKGKEYITKVVKRLALFPQQVGTLNIAPFQVELAILLEEPGANGFFFNRQVQRMIAQTAPTSVRVRELPPAALPAFTGAVGTFTAFYTLDKTEVTTDDVLSLRLSITGNGDIKRVQPPALMLSDSFEVYDPKIIDETSYEESGELIGRKEIEYLIVPKKPGVYQLSPDFSYFDPGKGNYIAIEKKFFSINVQQGSLEAPSATKAIEESAEEDIRFIKLKDRLYQSKDHFFGNTIFWTLTVLPFALLGFVILIKRRQLQWANVDAFQLKRQRAREVALRHLKDAAQYLKEGKHRAFYDEIFKALLGYVCDKLHLPLSTLTKYNVQEKLHTLNVEEPLIQHFMQLIQTCEIALFAGKEDEIAQSELYSEALEVITKMEAFLGK